MHKALLKELTHIIADNRRGNELLDLRVILPKCRTRNSKQSCFDANLMQNNVKVNIKLDRKLSRSSP